MIVLPDEDDEPVGAQVRAAIGEALRASVAGAQPSAGFAARLAAALDAAERGGDPPAPAASGGTPGQGTAAETAS